MQTRRISKVLGLIVIGISLLLCLYLVLYYSSLWIFGPSKLHSWLGDKYFNAIYPLGGIYLILSIVFFISIFLGPLIIGTVIAKLLRKSMPIGLIIILLILPIATVLTPTFYNIIKYRYRFGDALTRVLWYENNTEWASGFSDYKFLKIKPGMTQQDVLYLLGEPLNRVDSHWIYTQQIDKTKNYDYRAVIFKKDGTVEEAYRSYYID